jgi:imidazole glycerol-phosphate synthase subunit HisF
MLRKRLITVLTFNNGTLFRTKLFDPDYRYTHNFVDSWSVDEIVILDITRDGEGDRDKFLDVIRTFAHDCFVPICIGGGVRRLDDVAELMKVGADKVMVNTGALERPELIKEISRAYGAQCAVVSIDAKKNDAGDYEVFANCGREATSKSPADWSQEAESLGAGEILITSIDRDGSLQGYDIDLCKSVSDSVSIPVLGLAGAGNWKHFLEGFEKGGLSAVCTQNIYHFTESSIASAKNFLTKNGIEVRL